MGKRFGSYSQPFFQGYAEECAIWKEKASLCLNAQSLLRLRQGMLRTVNPRVSTSP
jgi:hypothetical protein